MSYIASNELARAVDNLRKTHCNASFVDYLVVLSANVRQGKTGTVSMNGKMLLEDTNRAKYVYGTADDSTAPYYNPLSGDYLSHRHWSNGPSDTVPRWATRDNSPIESVTDSTAKTKTVRVKEFNGPAVRAFFGIDDSNRVSLASIACWWYRATDLDDKGKSPAPRIGELVDRFLRDINLTKEQASQIFAPISEATRPIATQDSPAPPTDYLPPLPKKKGFSNKLPHNLIVTGAPGTGKSHLLDEMSKKGNFAKVRRVTFYEDYMYSQFVGSLRPRTIDDKTTGARQIAYEFAPGPFMRTYVDAITEGNEGKNYLLIIEEINRANAAAVFGDTFQLLDRKTDDNSKYPIQPTFDIADYLASPLLDEEGNQIVLSEQRPKGRLSLPANMYIWATMNSADQGVFPIDTAFRRRWEFHHLDIDNSEDAIDAKGVHIGSHEVSWNKLRKALNRLLQGVGVEEDKLLGPFFLELGNLRDSGFTAFEGLGGADGNSKPKETVFQHAFKDKVIEYVFDDAGRARRRDIFAKENATLSQLCKDFDTEGVEIFKGITWADVMPDPKPERTQQPTGTATAQPGPPSE